MGRDRSPKERQRLDLQRKRGRKAGYERILIVSEGSKTEPNYFREIRADQRLHGTNVVVQPSAFGTQPIQVVEYAWGLFKNGDKNKSIVPRAFERVYAVFDRDDHPSFHKAISRARELDGTLKNDENVPVKFLAIPSRPSFEFWLLLHFEDVHHLIPRTEVMRRLKKHLPNYEKGCKETFADTKLHLRVAIDRARKINQMVDLVDDGEPYTAVADLVEILTNLKK